MCQGVRIWRNKDKAWKNLKNEWSVDIKILDSRLSVIYHYRNDVLGTVIMNCEVAVLGVKIEMLKLRNCGC